jgi:thiol-disulfide isomerase/thioredoxin
MITARTFNPLSIPLVALCMLLACGCGERRLSPSEASGAEVGSPSAGYASRMYSLRFATLQGQQQSLQGLAGRTFLLVFWAPWCVLCRDEMESLQRLAVHMGPKALPIVAVAVQTSAAAVESWQREHGELPFEILLDSRGDGQRYFGLSSLPVAVVIDGKGEAIPFPDPESGIPLRRIEGARDWGSYEVVRAFRELLQVKQL